MDEIKTDGERNIMPRKKKIDQLESFFIRETSKLLDLYDQIRETDPRGNAITGDTLSLDDEVAIVKHSWAALVSYAKIYGYIRFEKVNPDIETFYLEVIKSNV